MAETLEDIEIPKLSTTLVEPTLEDIEIPTTLGAVSQLKQDTLEDIDIPAPLSKYQPKQSDTLEDIEIPAGLQQPTEPPPALAAPTTTRPTGELDERGFVGKTLGALGAGTLRAGAGLVSSQSAWDEGLSKLTNMAGIKFDPYGIRSRGLKDLSTALNKKATEWSPNAGGGIIDSVKAGRPDEAASKLWYMIAENAPQLAVAIGSVAIGQPEIGLAMMGTSAGGSKYSELEETNPDMPYTEKMAVSAGAGAIEALTERLGSMRIWKGLFDNKATKDVAKQTVGSIVRRAATGFAKAGGGEAVEEAAAQVSNNIVDMLAGVPHNGKPAQWNDGVTDSMLTALFLGGTAGAIYSGTQRGKPETPPVSTPPSPTQPAQPAVPSDVEAGPTEVSPETEVAKPVEQVAATESVAPSPDAELIAQHVNPNYAQEVEQEERITEDDLANNPDLAGAIVENPTGYSKDMIELAETISGQKAKVVESQAKPTGVVTDDQIKDIKNNIITGARGRAALDAYHRTGDRDKAEQAWIDAGDGLYGGQRRVSSAVDGVISAYNAAKNKTWTAQSQQTSPPTGVPPVPPVTTTSGSATTPPNPPPVVPPTATGSLPAQPPTPPTGPLVKPDEQGVAGKIINKLANFFAYGAARLRVPQIRIPVRDVKNILDSAYKFAPQMVNEVLARGKVGKTTKADMAVSFALDENQPWQELGLNKTPESQRQHRLYNELDEIRDVTTEKQVEAGVLSQETVDRIKADWGNYMPRGPAAVALARAFETASEPQKRAMSNSIRDAYRQRKGKLTLKQLAQLITPEAKKRLMASGMTETQIKQQAEAFQLKDSDYVLDRGLFNPVYLAYVMQTHAMELIAIRSFIDKMKQRDVGLAVIASDPAIAGDPNYIDPSKVLDAVSVKALTNYKIHKLGAEILNEFAAQRKRNTTWLDKALSITKQGQFFNPGVMVSYNVLAPYLRGVGDFRFWKFPEIVNQSRKDWMGGTTQYQNFLKYGGNPSPNLATQKTADEAMRSEADKLRADLSPWRNSIKVAFERVYAKKRAWGDDPIKSAVDAATEAVMLPYRAIGSVTWLTDEYQRYATYYGAMDSSMNANEKAVWRMDSEQRKTADPNLVRRVEKMERYYSNRVGKAMGDYGLFSQASKDVLSKIFFVYTFRFAQPLEQLKTFVEPFTLMYRALAKEGSHKIAGYRFDTTKPESYEWKSAAQAVGGTIALPLIIYSLMKANGWEPDEEGQPEALKKLTRDGSVLGMPLGVPLGLWKNHWKYKKTVTNPNGERREMVVGLNTLTNMPIKWFTRATVARPQVLDDKFWHIGNLMKWEIHPMYRIAFDAVSNEPSMGSQPPRNPLDSPHKQLADTAWYVFSNLFRMYGEAGSMGGSNDSAFQRKVKQDLDGGLNLAEKVFLGYYAMSPVSLGYTYSRAERRVRYGIAMEQLERAVAGTKGRMKQEYRDRPQELGAQTARLNQVLVERKRKLYNIFLGEQKQ